MPAEISFSDCFAVMTVRGNCYPDEVRKLLTPLFKNSESNIELLLIDSREATNNSNTEELKEFSRIYASSPVKRIAVVVDKTLHFGLTRMFGSYTQLHSKQDVAVFYDMEQARMWLLNR